MKSLAIPSPTIQYGSLPVFNVSFFICTIAFWVTSVFNITLESSLFLFPILPSLHLCFNVIYVLHQSVSLGQDFCFISPQFPLHLFPSLHLVSIQSLTPLAFFLPHTSSSFPQRSDMKTGALQTLQKTVKQDHLKPRETITPAVSTDVQPQHKLWVEDLSWIGDSNRRFPSSCYQILDPSLNSLPIPWSIRLNSQPF